MKDNKFSLLIDDTSYVTNVTAKFKLRKKYVSANPAKLLAFIPGTIREIFIKAGDKVRTGDPLLILEAMKMRNEVKAQFNANIKNIFVSSNDIVMKNQLLIEFELE